MRLIKFLGLGLWVCAMSFGPAWAQSAGTAEISTGAGKAPGVKTDARTLIPAADPSRAKGNDDSSEGSKLSRPIARWVSSACLARPPWFGKVVVSREANTCLVGTPNEDDADAAAPSPLQLAWIAADRAMAVAEPPDLRIAPGRIGLTGLKTYFWLDHEPPRVWATASVPGVLVTAEAYPIRYGWTFDEDARRTTTDIGRAWSRRAPGTISHMYERRGTYQVSVDVIWQARWRIGAGVWMHLGYFSNGQARDYPVRQMVSRLTRR